MMNFSFFKQKLNTPSHVEPENYGNFIEWIKSDNINTPAVFLTEEQE